MERPLINFESHSSILLADEVRKICVPLFQYFDADFFYFIRSYYKGPRKGKRLLLCSNENWVKDYFSIQHYKHELVNFPEAFRGKNFIVSTWDGCKSDHQSCKIGILAQQKYHYSHFLYLTWVFNESIEVYCFGFKKTQDHIYQKLLFNIDVFKHFCHYFNIVSEDLIQTAENDAFNIPVPQSKEFSNPHFLGLEFQKKQNFLQSMPIDKIFLKRTYQDVYLTAEEAKTIVLACQALRYSDIAKLLSVSVHTIKYRMNNIREKLGAKNKKALIELFIQDQLVDLCKFLIEEQFTDLPQLISSRIKATKDKS
jgi:DNA-binding CsgD family transcriptional regulator